MHPQQPDRLLGLVYEVVDFRAHDSQGWCVWKKGGRPPSGPKAKRLDGRRSSRQINVSPCGASPFAARLQRLLEHRIGPMLIDESWRVARPGKPGPLYRPTR